MPLPVINVARMREWEDATWESGQSVETVMRQAGAAVAQTAMQLTPPGASVLVLAGKGNNGGDARYAVEYISDREITLIDATDPSKALDELPHHQAKIGSDECLIIDGLFGIGLNRPLEGDWLSLIAFINEMGQPVLAVDCPSGLDCDTGEVLGAVIKADVTVTFGAPKIGMISSEAEACVGRIEVAADIGLVPLTPNSDIQWIMPSDFDGFPPARPTSGHKGTFGHLGIIAGSQGYHGAAVIAAKAAHRAMPGLVTLFTTPEAYQPVAAQLAQTMVKPLSAEFEPPPKCTALLVGPGLAGPEIGDEIRDTVRRLWVESPLPLIADASALDWLPQDASPPAPRIITPHPGEAGRMINGNSGPEKTIRLRLAPLLHDRYGGCHVVLKGNRTVISHGKEQRYINSSGNPDLGQGGSGDALAGYLGGLLAQPSLHPALDRLVRFAVWEHGRTADLLSDSSLAWDLEDFILRLGNSRLSL